MPNYKRVYAVRDTVTGEIKSRYTKNGFFSRRADADNMTYAENKSQTRYGKPPKFETVQSELVWSKCE